MTSPSAPESSTTAPATDTTATTISTPNIDTHDKDTIAPTPEEPTVTTAAVTTNIYDENEEPGDILRELAKFYEAHPVSQRESDYIFVDEDENLKSVATGRIMRSNFECDIEVISQREARLLQRNELADPLRNLMRQRVTRLETAEGSDFIHPSTLVAYSPALRLAIHTIRGLLLSGYYGIDDITKQLVQESIEQERMDLAREPSPGPDVATNTAVLGLKRKHDSDSDDEDAPSAKRHAGDQPESSDQPTSPQTSLFFSASVSSQPEAPAARSPAPELRYVAEPPVWPTEWCTPAGASRIIYGSGSAIAHPDLVAMDRAIVRFNDMLAEYMIGEALRVN